MEHPVFYHLKTQNTALFAENNFKLSYRKTQYKGKQTITGVNVFLNKIDAPDKIIEKSKAEIAEKKEIKHYTNYLNNIRKTNGRKKAST